MEVQPGQTINPGDDSNKPNEPTPEPVPVVADTPKTNPTPANEEDSTWQYNNDDVDQSNLPSQPNVVAIDWTASEFIDHDKQASWFVSLAVVAVIGATLVYLITHDLVATVMIVIAAALFGVTASRKPSTLQYHLDQAGIKIGNKFYGYNLFKSFSVFEEGAIDSILLTPLGRLSPPITLYYPPDQEDQILGTLGSYLPHEQRTHDPVDRLMRRIRF